MLGAQHIMKSVTVATCLQSQHLGGSRKIRRSRLSWLHSESEASGVNKKETYKEAAWSVILWFTAISEGSRRASLCFKSTPSQNTTKQHVLISRNTATVRYKCIFSKIYLLQAVKPKPRDPELPGGGLVLGPELQLQ